MNINLNEFVKNLYQYSNVNDLEIKRAVDIFLQYVKISKAKATYRYYESHLRLIAEFLENNNISFISKINTDLLNSFVLRSQNLKISNSTINKRIGALKAMITYLNKEGFIQQELKYEKLKEVKPEIQIVSIQNLKRVLADAKRNCTRQNYLIVLILISTGIRRTELTLLEKKYINFNDNSIYLEHTKTNQPRYIYFTEEIKQLILSEINSNNSKWLFYSPILDSHISVSQVDSIFYRMKKRLNLDKLSPHKFRHTYATVLLNNGANLEEVRLLLGHSSYEMTKKYLHINNKKLADVSTHLNPLTSILNE